jgi:hypothetical protein
MSDYATFKESIAEWANREDWSDALLSSFVSMAEQKFNSELRVDRMLQMDSGVAYTRCVQLPDDWLQMQLVKTANPNAADGYLPIRYKSNDEFFNLTDCWAYGYYTIVGRSIYFGGAPDATNGIGFIISYYGEVPVFSDTQDSWIYTKYPNMYLFGALMHVGLHAVGEEMTALGLKTLCEDMILKLNNDHLRAKASGSRLTRSRVRSFG